jgi:hypothetical protein
MPPKKHPSVPGGRVLSASELRRIRRSLEEFDSIDAVDDEMR